MKSFAPLLALAAVVCAQQQQLKPNAAECAQANILAQMIQANILDQQEEQKALGAVEQALAEKDQVAFGQARDQLLTVVNNGITIRQAAQQISPKNNAAAQGLDTVKNAQLTELGLALNLTGNPNTDNAIVEQLKKDFADGIEQNKLNAAAAVQGCGAAGANGGGNNDNGTVADGAGKDKAKGKNNGNKDQNNQNNQNGASNGAKKAAAKQAQQAQQAEGGSPVNKADKRAVRHARAFGLW
ncbi:hypothetical protein GGTG_02063 [Gaeumannomyces tritici R3-111a-1]|uniref:Cell wall protein n=1 Tax=Gaeumannomyces tritici (strain R3-111a-1) TaxID=644352 RepID=J3NLB5_GAET3|nr:hypothetical protein GGTG_02063 [Gaeumannomyces tritici R3-111a-1]EJT82089.1 hypothetical protein GGTG_02063 [Gaeumannomyces tritici R3-111a-1]